MMEQVVRNARTHNSQSINHQKELHMKHNHLFVPILLTAVLFGLYGCTIAKISGRGALPLLLNNPPQKVEVLQNVSVSKMRVFDYTGAFDVSEVLSELMIGSNADALINLNITVKTTVVDFLVNLITLGLANSRTFEVQGQAVKAPQGLGYLEIPGSEVIQEASTIHELNLVPEDNFILPSTATMIARTPSGFALVHYNPNAITVNE